jgi:hypothetical protein
MVPAALNHGSWENVATMFHVATVHWSKTSGKTAQDKSLKV